MSKYDFHISHSKMNTILYECFKSKVSINETNNLP